MTDTTADREALTAVFNKWNADRDSEPRDLFDAILAAGFSRPTTPTDNEVAEIRERQDAYRPPMSNWMSDDEASHLYQAVADRATLLRKLSTIGGAGQWRQMATAPRDTTPVLLLTKNYGVTEAWFSPGSWSEDTPVSPREYSGDVWVCADDEFQIEAEATGNPEDPWHDEGVLGWLPRSVLPTAPADTSPPAKEK
jgi:hypothetical protein